MAASVDLSDDESLISGINVTPLVDVVLVLLIIFLITAPVIYQSAIKVRLPKAATGEQSEKSLLNFTVTKDGQVMWNRNAVDWDTLKSRLGGMGADHLSGETAMISADEDTHHGIVIHLMDVLREAGLTRFALNVEGAPPRAAAR